MSDAKPDNMLQLPSREARVEMALARMGNTGIRAVGMDQTTLVGLCVRLTDPMVKDVDAWRWLNVELGGSDDEQVVDDNVVYRFRGRFAPYFDQITREQVLRASKLAVEQVTDHSVTPLNRKLLSQQVASRLLDAGGDLSAGDMIKLAAIVRDSERNELEQQDLERKQRETAAKLEIAEQRERQLAALNEKLEAENTKRRAAVESAKRDVQTAVEAGSKTLEASDVIAILDRVMKGDAA